MDTPGGGSRWRDPDELKPGGGGGGGPIVLSPDMSYGPVPVPKKPQPLLPAVNSLEQIYVAR